jgi:hypothetical protein
MNILIFYNFIFLLKIFKIQEKEKNNNNKLI